MSKRASAPPDPNSKRSWRRGIAADNLDADTAAARARAKEHRRRLAERTAAQEALGEQQAAAVAERVKADRAALGLPAAPAPVTADAIDRARTVWLDQPVRIGPSSMVRVLAYSVPPGPPEWLAEHLDNTPGMEARNDDNHD